MMGGVVETDGSTEEQHLFLLNSYAAKGCSVKIRNKYDPRAVPLPRVEDPFMEMLGERGDAFELDVYAKLVAAQIAGLVDIRETATTTGERVTATKQAIAEGAAIIIDPALPADLQGHRVGEPDILLRSTDDEEPKYWPVDVKNHTIHKHPNEKSTAIFSTLKDPFITFAAGSGSTPGTSKPTVPKKLQGDMLQLCHYWRMLESLGYAPAGNPRGAILSNDLVDDEPVLTWMILNETGSEAGNIKPWRPVPDDVPMESFMDLYDFEHSLRVAAAEAGLEQWNAGPEPDALDPVPVDTCKDCAWRERCGALSSDKGYPFSYIKLEPRETIALRDEGIVTTKQLASLAPGEQHEPNEAQAFDLAIERSRQWSRPADADKRFAKAVKYSRMIRDGEIFERIGPVNKVPRADVEIDFDIEYDYDPDLQKQITYLAGFWVTDRRVEPLSHEYVDFSCWDAKVDWGKHVALAVESWNYINRCISGAEATGHSCRIYHYSDPEQSYFKGVGAELEELGLTGTVGHAVFLKEFFKKNFVDIRKLVEKSFFGLNGAGLKTVAKAFTNHSWGVEAVGGDVSRTWLEQIREGSPEIRENAIQTMLTYNENDVKATWEIREWLDRLAAEEAGDQDGS